MLTRDKNRLWTTWTCLAVASEQESCRESLPFTLTPNLSNLIVTNPVLAKHLEHPPLTR